MNVLQAHNTLKSHIPDIQNIYIENKKFGGIDVYISTNKSNNFEEIKNLTENICNNYLPCHLKYNIFKYEEVSNKALQLHDIKFTYAVLSIISNVKEYNILGTLKVLSLIFPQYTFDIDGLGFDVDTRIFNVSVKLPFRVTMPNEFYEEIDNILYFLTPLGFLINLYYE